MCDILMVNPSLVGGKKGIPFYGGHMLPLGLLSIAAVLEKNNYDIRFVDFDLDFSMNPYDVIRQEMPKMVFITGASFNRFESFEIARKVKEISHEIITVYGGTHASFTAEDTLTYIKEIDIIARGEGELTSLDLAKVFIDHKLNLSDILGISYRNNGKITHNANRPRIANLDTLPFPARHLVNMKRYMTQMDFLNMYGLHVMTSRGCPVQCAFCSAGKMWGDQYTMRSAKNIVDEIEILIKDYHAKGIKFFDSTLTLNRNHMLNLCRELRHRKISLPWECEVRANTVDKDMLLTMREAGCYYIDIGLESTTQEIINNINKQITVEQVKNVIKWAKNLGMRVKLFLIYGLPGETLKSAMKTFDFKAKYEKIADIVTIGPVMVFPGVRIEQLARQNGTLPPDFSWSLPFKNIEEKRLTNIPYFLQPKFGYREYGRCFFMEYKTRRLPKSPLLFLYAKIKNIKSLDDIKHYFAVAKKYFKWEFGLLK